jgi:hypothetical protein
MSNENRCGTCTRFSFSDQGEDVGVCRRFPPQVVMAPAPSSLAGVGGGMRLTPMSTYPNVHVQFMACAEYVLSVEKSMGSLDP